MRRLTRMAVLACTLGLLAVPAARATEAEGLFKFYCAQCHGLEGKGNGPNVTETFPVEPRNFTDAKQMNKLTDADIRNVVREGGPVASKSPMMPPWGKTLSDAEIDKLIKYLRKLCQCKGKQG